MKQLGLLLMALAIIPIPGLAQEKITFKKMVWEMPNTGVKALKKSFSREALPAWAGIAASTAILYHYDSDLYEGAQATGRRWGLSNQDFTKTVAKFGKYDLLRLPTDTASAIYFMGDGWLDLAVAGSFMAYGHFNNEVRPFNTSLEILHGMAVSAFAVQVLKRSTGRESPSERTEPRGRWSPFPSMNEYNRNTAKYDAMPSGHIMTSTLVFTVIRTNYPEYDSILLPLEVTWLSVLGFGMLNNGAHWASDYPLGIAMGYVIGKAATTLGQANVAKKASSQDSVWAFFPGMDPNGEAATVNAVRFF